ncbi:hypothetical protein VTK56DRAFT_1001 [Thermocarpiscus australiensis]
MANQLLRARDAPPVGQRWAYNFVKRQPELRTRYSRRYDYQRAKCEDPKVIGEWFALVRNTKAKYGIVDDDIYNFDETGFIMGIICADWIKHFDHHTAPRAKGKYRLLILDGHESHYSTEFELYC